MDQKTIEMNNLRVLHDYLNQTIDVLMRGQRLGQNGHGAGLPFASFGGALPGAPIGSGVDVVYGQGPAGWTGSPVSGWAGSPVFGGVSAPFQATPFQATNPFTGMPMYGAGYVDPFAAQRGIGIGGGAFGSWQQPWQQPWSPIAEASRQATVAQALAAKQSVLEAMWRVCGTV
jgi:hypothetical protein